MARAAGALLLAWSAVAAAQSIYPARPIRFVVPYAPGEYFDGILRKTSEELARAMGQPWLVENRPGGNMTVALEGCARAQADGYTLCLINSTGLSLNPHLMARVPYDPDADFKPVASLYGIVSGVFVASAVPASSVRDFVAYARSRPGKVSDGTTGPGTATDVARHWLNDQWKTEIVGVGYKSGPAIVQAIMAGEVQFMWLAVYEAQAALKANRVRLLAVDGVGRAAALPDVPTFRETGLSDSPVMLWHGLGAPGTTPDAIVRRVNAEVGRLWSDPKMQQYLDDRFLRGFSMTPESFAAFIRRHRERVGELVRLHNLSRP
jgi:tripartite-type tricarboxylate transporter receptor subunit TctC